MTIDLGEPTKTAACPLGTCRRVVGPYYHQRAAAEAIADHVHWRHRAVRSGRPFPYDPDRRADTWDTSDTD